MAHGRLTSESTYLQKQADEAVDHAASDFVDVVTAMRANIARRNPCPIHLRNGPRAVIADGLHLLPLWFYGTPEQLGA
jgi:hypothetical protein